MALKSTGLISLYKCWFGKNLKPNQKKKKSKTQLHEVKWEYLILKTQNKQWQILKLGKIP